MSGKLAAFHRSTFGQTFVGAAMLWAALPPLGWWPLAWIAPAWWVMLARRTELPGQRPYRALWLVGFLFWLAAYHWLRLPHWATSFGWVALACYLGFYLPVFVGLVRLGVHRLRVPLILAAPIVWTGLELARAHLLTGITMADLGHTQYRWIELIQVSDLAGAYGVSFVVMFVTACLARALPCEDKPLAAWPLIPLAVVLGVTLIYGYARVSDNDPRENSLTEFGDCRRRLPSPTQTPSIAGRRRESPPTVRIALIQGSIDSRLKADPDKRDQIHQHYLELSEEAIRRHDKLDLIVWPETMFRDTLYTFDLAARAPKEWGGSEEEFQHRLRQIAEDSRAEMAWLANHLGVPLVLGVDTYRFTAAGRQRFNSAVLVSRRGEILDRYDKMHLVIFGEYVPFAESFPWLYRFTPLDGGVTAGTRPAVFDAAGLRIAPNICYETILPHVIRRQVNDLERQGRPVDVLMNLTNDGWYWGSSELDMHLICGVFRAVECRKPLLIAANTGFSAWIDADGRLRAVGPRRDTDIILAQVHSDERTSWYLAHGDTPAGACLAVCLIFAAVACRDRLRGWLGSSEASPQEHRVAGA